MRFELRFVLHYLVPRYVDPFTRATWAAFCITIIYNPNAFLRKATICTIDTVHQMYFGVSPTELLNLVYFFCCNKSTCHPNFTDKKVLRKFHWQSFWSTRLTKMLQWLHLNNSHAYPFCKTTPGTISESHQQSCAIELWQQFLDVAIATEFLSVKLAQNGRKTIWSVKVRVHLKATH